MVVACAALWPDGTAHTVNHWGHIAGELGSNAPLARPWLLCLRGVRPFATETHELMHSPEYDDTGVLLYPGDAPIVFPMASHAYQARSRLSPDVNRDGQGDVGSIRPGRYVLHDLGTEECIFHVRNPDGSDRLPCWRDFNGDRFLSAEEMRRSEALRTGAQVGADGTWADSILLHGGLDSPPDAKHRYSIGCLTAPLARRDMLRRRAKLHGGEIDLVLANASDVLPLAAEARRLYGQKPEDIA
jgi:hypothetical protein